MQFVHQFELGVRMLLIHERVQITPQLRELLRCEHGARGGDVAVLVEPLDLRCRQRVKRLLKQA